MLQMKEKQPENFEQRFSQEKTMKPYVIPLSDPQADLETVGGKGMSLAKLARAGLPVPGGFHLTTEAYQEFVTANNLQDGINDALKTVDTMQPSTLEIASEEIGRLFAQAEIPGDLANAIVNAYAALPGSNPAVAVRSSATAEDLPDASFAGQQETYLNITRADQVLEATKKCWASLWTARAIGYRARQGIGTEGVALAVVVQLLINAEAAGIMFTANPLNGNRNETVINAAWGLGEAVVGGAVTPDTITVNKLTGVVIAGETAEKLVMTVRTGTGTEEQPVPDSLQKVPVLSDEQAAQLSEIGAEIEELYGMPMDIEWTLEDGKFAIVQARPITAMAEATLDWPLPDPKGVYMRTSIADLMPEALSPMFITLGIPTLRKQMNPLAKRVIGGNPDMGPYYFTNINTYAYMNSKFPSRTWGWIIFRMLPAYPGLIRGLVPLWRNELHPEYQEFVTSKRDLIPTQLSAAELWREIQELFNAAAYYMDGLMFATMGASAGSEMLLTRVYNKMAKQEGDPEATALLMGWDNIPVRSEKSLYDIAMWVRENDELEKLILKTPTKELTAKYAKLAKENKNLGVLSGSQSLFSEFASRLHTHLDIFGHVVFQLDFAEDLPLDHPEMMIETIKMYLRGEGTNPYERQQASQQKRIETTETMLNRLKGIKLWLFRMALIWGQSLAEVREDALAEMGLAYPKMRELLRELGQRFVNASAIEDAEDIFWLEKDEIQTCVEMLETDLALENLSNQVEKRKAFNKKVSQVTPPPMIPMKERVMGFKSEIFIAKTEDAQGGNLLKGVPASAGVVTAPACVLHGPEDFNQMRPGDVLVAGTTTPAWTPLFAMASAVVTDIGGPLSHGSIVAREYGIPAVMGTGVATHRIQSGQVITVDGTNGEVILETSEEDQPQQPAPPTEWKRFNPKAVYARGSLAEHLPNAVSPLFGTLGIRAVNEATLELKDVMNIDLLEADYQYRVVNGYVYMGFLMSLKFSIAMIGLAISGMKFMFKGGIERWQAGRNAMAGVVAKWDDKIPETLSPSEILTGVSELMYAAGKYYTVIQSGTLPTASSSEIVFTLLYKMVRRKADPEAPTLLFGLDTVPLRTEKSLYDLGMWVRERSALRDFTLLSSTEELIAALQTESIPGTIPATDWREFKSRFEKHLDEFGHTSYEFDFMNPTPVETPGLILNAVKTYVEGKGSDPYARQKEVIENRELTIRKIRNRFNLIPNRWFNNIFKWAMDTGPAREDSIADMGMGHTTMRRLLAELGNRFAINGALEDANDIYWLVEDEVDSLASLLENGEHLPDHSVIAAERKAIWREQMRLTPPAVLPENSSWTKLFPWSKVKESSSILKGLGASAGKVTATARVLFGPEDFKNMKQGNILVAVTTTPAWTPLFTLASAVVTDIGGPLSHSSIVAREYGIPAVLATGIGTRRIQDGQTITVNGNTGTVELH